MAMVAVASKVQEQPPSDHSRHTATQPRNDATSYSVATQDSLLPGHVASTIRSFKTQASAQQPALPDNRSVSLEDSCGSTSSSTSNSSRGSGGSRGSSSGGNSLLADADVASAVALELETELEVVRRERDDALQLVQELAAQAAGLVVMLDDRGSELSHVCLQRDLLRRQLDASRAAMLRCAALLASGRLTECVRLAVAVAGVRRGCEEGSAMAAELQLLSTAAMAQQLAQQLGQGPAAQWSRQAGCGEEMGMPIEGEVGDREGAVGGQ